MESILYDQLRSKALKQYIKQLAPEKLQQLIKNPDISEADLKLIQKNTGNETIKRDRIILCVRMNSSLK